MRPRGDGHAVRFLLVHHIHHVGLAAGIEMGEFAHAQKRSEVPGESLRRTSGGVRVRNLRQTKGIIAP